MSAGLEDITQAGEAIDIYRNGVRDLQARPITPSQVQVPAEMAALREMVAENEKTLALKAKFFAKLSLAQRSIGKLGATGRHDKGFAYIKDEDIVEAANEAASNAGLAIIFTPVKHEATKLEGSTQKGAAVMQGQINLRLTLGDTETGFERAMGDFIGIDVDYGGTSYFKKALTAAKKQALQAVFNIAVSDTPGGNTKARTDKTPVLSGDKGSITADQKQAVRKAYSAVSNRYGKATADAALASTLTTYGVTSVDELSELRASSVPAIIESAGERLGKEKPAAT
jgi:hypothetical protein